MREATPGEEQDREEDPLRQALRQRRGLPCAFERALLRGCASCGRMRRILLAEREAVGCTDAGCSRRCAEWLQAIRHAVRFVLHEPSAERPWAHSREIRAQCGGLIGLRRVLACDEQDVDRLLDAVGERYDAQPALLPVSELIEAVSKYQPRRSGAAPAG